MISHVNDAIERTSRLLGVDPDLVVDSAVPKFIMPTYARGGLV